MIQVVSFHLRAALAVAMVLIVLVLAACNSPTPILPSAQPAPTATATSTPVAPTATATSTPLAPTATVTTPVQPTVLSENTATSTPTAMLTIIPTATRGRVVVPPEPTSAGPLEFTLNFAQSAQRKGDRKIQLTVILRIQGGAPPFQVLEDNIPQSITETESGVQYTRDWHNCDASDPHTITLVSADGQQGSQAVMLPYTCD